MREGQQTATAGEAFAKAAAIKPDDVDIQLDYLDWLYAGKRRDDAAARLTALRSRKPEVSTKQRGRLLALEARVKQE